MPEGIGGSGECNHYIVTSLENFNTSLERALSPERFTSYRTIGNDDDHAWALYRWNLDLAAATGPILSDFEVTLRNTLHRELARHLGRDDWWTVSRLRLDQSTQESLAAVTQRHRKKLAKGSVGPGRVIADLTLGTWVQLLSKGGVTSIGQQVDYETRLWRPALRNGFDTGETNSRGAPKRPTRKEVHRRAENMQQLRNAVAHHRRISEGIRRFRSSENEPRVPLLTVLDEATELLGWMCPELAELHRSSDTISELLNHPPPSAATPSTT